MSSYLIPLAKQDLLNHMLQVGGVAVCPLQRPEQTIHASFEVELTDDNAVISVDFGGHTGELTLKRSDRANHLHLRDFIQDIANGRIESAEPAPPPRTTHSHGANSANAGRVGSTAEQRSRTARSLRTAL